MSHSTEFPVENPSKVSNSSTNANTNIVYTTKLNYTKAEIESFNNGLKPFPNLPSKPQGILPLCENCKVNIEAWLTMQTKQWYSSKSFKKIYPHKLCSECFTERKYSQILETLSRKVCVTGPQKYKYYEIGEKEQ